MYQFINRNSYFGRYSCLSSLASTGPRPFQLRGIWVSNLLYYWIGKYLRYRKCPLLCLDKLVITARTKEDIFLPFLFNSVFFFLRFKIFFFLSFFYFFACKTSIQLFLNKNCVTHFFRCIVDIAYKNTETKFLLGCWHVCGVS